MPEPVNALKRIFRGDPLETDQLETNNIESLLKEAESRFKSIFLSVNDGIFIVSASEGKIIVTNQVAVEMLGYKDGELDGMSVERIHPNEMEQLKKTIANVLDGNPVLTDEFSCLKKDNKRIPVEMSFSQVSLGGVTHVLALVRDISERKIAEMNLKRALSEISQLKNRLEAENIYLKEEIKLDHNFEEIISQSEVLKKVLRSVEQVASTDTTVLILGETGTGKELLARAIHSISNRRKHPLVKVNCAALPSELIESELFGHEKGAFTGALTKKIGRFELANGGTIFLDEVGELPVNLQAKLLRVLQEGEFERLGSTKSTKVDIRVMAATNRDPEAAIQSGTFRRDLFYRLNVFPIKSPPLRERKEDIPLLVRFFVKKFSQKTGKKIETIPKKLLRTLESYSWPGNVRELENIVERAVIVSRASTLELGDWFTVNENNNKEKDTLTLVELEKKHILKVLELTCWRVSGEKGAAKILDLKPTTLESKMKKLKISRSDPTSSSNSS